MFEKILIANRGEIACRVIKTARRMGIATVAVYSDADAGALHVQDGRRGGPYRAAAGEPVLYRRSTGSSRPSAQTGAEAVHPGYGFLSERADFAEALDGGGGRLHRPAGGRDPGDGRQDHLEEARGRGRGLDGAGPHGADRRRRARGRDRARDRLSGDDQGLGRRRRQGDAHRLERRGGARGVRAVAVGGGVELRRRPDLHREVRDRSRGTSRSRCWGTSTATVRLPATSGNARSSGGTRR